jgi:hypothetical protein
LRFSGRPRLQGVEFGVHLIKSLEQFDDDFDHRKIVAADFPQRGDATQHVNGIAGEVVTGYRAVRNWRDKAVFPTKQNGVARQIGQARSDVDSINRMRSWLEQL